MWSRPFVAVVVALSRYRVIALSKVKSHAERERSACFVQVAGVDQRPSFMKLADRSVRLVS